MSGNDNVTPIDQPLPGTEQPDPVAADTPPERGRRKRPTTRAGRAAAREAKDKAPRPPRAPRPRSAPLGPRIAALHTVVGTTLAVGTQVPIPVLGTTVPPTIGAFGAQLAEDAAAFGDAWEKYARANPRVADALDKLLTVSELGTLLALYGKAAYNAAAMTGKVPPLDMSPAPADAPAA